MVGQIKEISTGFLQTTYILKKYPEIKQIGRIVSLNFENILKIDIDCSFDKNLSIEKVHDLTSEIEQLIRAEIKNAVITDRKSTRLNSSHSQQSRMPSSA